MILRSATLDDARGLREIYNPYAESTTVTFDVRGRSHDEQVTWLQAHLGAYPVVVAEDDGELLGYASLSPWRDRPAYRTSVEDSVYVRADRHRHGLGRRLLAGILRAGTEHGFHTVFARIVDGHEASIALHRGLGFEVVGVEREVGRKFNRWLDVVVLQRLLSAPPPPR